VSREADPPRKRFPARLPLADATARGASRPECKTAIKRPATPALAPRLQVGAPTSAGLMRPQDAWAQTLREQGRALPPSGMGLEAPRFRLRLVERLRVDGCSDAEVLAAIGAVPRHCFVDPALVAQAYEDTSLPIGLGQTISKPSVVARMLSLLRQRPDGERALGRVLEIGTGCGYQAALLERLARQVYSVERLKPLFDKARDNLAEIRSDRLRLIYGDGRFGHPPNAPYDGIIAAAGGEDIPGAWLDQLAPSGRLVAPCRVGDAGEQRLVVIDRLIDGSFKRCELEPVRFVPLQSGVNDSGVA
jgi:protein-L-isoaspartate(D-aspartate) O-methyltransferase